jgi:hypothetical protein
MKMALELPFSARRLKPVSPPFAEVRLSSCRYFDFAVAALVKIACHSGEGVF